MIEIKCYKCKGLNHPSNRIIFSSTIKKLVHVTCINKGDAWRDDFDVKESTAIKDKFIKRDWRDNL